MLEKHAAWQVGLTLSSKEIAQCTLQIHPDTLHLWVCLCGDRPEQTFGHCRHGKDTRTREPLADNPRRAAGSALYPYHS